MTHLFPARVCQRNGRMQRMWDRGLVCGGGLGGCRLECVSGQQLPCSPQPFSVHARLCECMGERKSCSSNL